jgi:DNA-binding GntR family transcriptional regulator
VRVAGEAAPAKYRRIADDLRARILSGEYAPGSPIPSKPKLMRVYGVSLATVNQAINVLKAEGYLWSRQGLATFVSDPLPAPGEAPGYEARLRRLEERMDAAEAALGLSAVEAKDDGKP